VRSTRAEGRAGAVVAELGVALDGPVGVVEGDALADVPDEDGPVGEALGALPHPARSRSASAPGAARTAWIS
jgi:hypothetical protein